MPATAGGSTVGRSMRISRRLAREVPPGEAMGQRGAEQNRQDDGCPTGREAQHNCLQRGRLMQVVQKPAWPHVCHQRQHRQEQQQSQRQSRQRRPSALPFAPRMI